MGRHHWPEDAWLVLPAARGLERFQFGEEGAGLGSWMVAGHCSPVKLVGKLSPLCLWLHKVGSHLCCLYAQIPCFPSPADKHASGAVKTFYFCNSNWLVSTGLGRPLSSAVESSPESRQAMVQVIWPCLEALLQVSMTVTCLTPGQSLCCLDSLKSLRWGQPAHDPLW